MVRAGLVLAASLVLVAGIVLGFAAVASADPIGPGFDLFATLPGAAVCLDPPLCTMVVALMGVPLDPPNLGDTDTIVRRHLGVDVFPDTIPIELVALSLHSVAPVLIGGSFFDVMVRGLPSPLGSMTIRHELPMGGTFDSILPVDARLTFTEVGNPDNTFTRDVSDRLFGSSTWGHEEPPGYPMDPKFPSGNFFPGVIREQGGFTFHPVRPATGVPEPSTLLLLASGLAGAVFGRKRLARQTHEAHA